MRQQAPWVQQNGVDLEPAGQGWENVPNIDQTKMSDRKYNRQKLRRSVAENRYLTNQKNRGLR